MGEHHAWECQFPSTFCVSFHCVKMDPVLATVMLKGRSEKAFILFCRPLGWTHRRFWNKTMQIRHVYIFNLFFNPSLLFETPSYWQEAMLPSSIPAAEHALTMIVLTFKHSDLTDSRPVLLMIYYVVYKEMLQYLSTYRFAGFLCNNCEPSNSILLSQVFFTLSDQLLWRCWRNLHDFLCDGAAGADAVL